MRVVRVIDRVCRISALALVSLLLLGPAAAQSELENAEAAPRPPLPAPHTGPISLATGSDSGTNEGLYLELGAGPSIPLGNSPVSLSTPLDGRLSLRDYYEGPAGGTTFGYFDGGLIASVPFSIIPPQYGTWSVTVRLRRSFGGGKRIA